MCSIVFDDEGTPSFLVNAGFQTPPESVDIGPGPGPTGAVQLRSDPGIGPLFDPKFCTISATTLSDFVDLVTVQPAINWVQLASGEWTLVVVPTTCHGSQFAPIHVQVFRIN